jgi:putative SOS response-associated peptidase YedK
MCGRFYMDPEDAKEIKKIIEEINDKYKDAPELSALKTGEIFPTDTVPTLTAQKPILMQWSFPRHDGKGQVINARLETAAEKPMFRSLFTSKRCLIPASGYFEWEKRGTTKQKYAIGLGEPLFMAGLYRLDAIDKTPRFVILTKPAAPKLEFIHDRMPVILAKDYHDAWLSNHLNTEEIMRYSEENLHYEPINYQPTLF